MSKKNTVLITNGATQMGFLIARALVAAKHRVILVDKDKSQLETMRKELPELCIVVCDISSMADRLSLYSKIVNRFKAFNVLIHGFVMPTKESLSLQAVEWEKQQQLIKMQLEAPMHISALFLPRLRLQHSAVILNLFPELENAQKAEAITSCALTYGLRHFFASLKSLKDCSNVRIQQLRLSTSKNGKVHPRFGDQVLDLIEANLRE